MKFFIKAQYTLSNGVWWLLQPTLLTDLIDISIVCENGNKYYAVNKNFRSGSADPKIVKVLPAPGGLWKTPREIADDILFFINHNRDGGKVELFGFKAALDFMILHQLLVKKATYPDYMPEYIVDIFQTASGFFQEQGAEYFYNHEDYAALPIETEYGQGRDFMVILQSHKDFPALKEPCISLEGAYWASFLHKFIADRQVEAWANDIDQQILN